VSHCKISQRQEAILDLISSHQIVDQESLVVLLKSMYKIDTNQAVVSRDLKKLNIVKKTVGDLRVYSVPQHDAHSEILRLAVVDIQHNESMIVVSTVPGLAPFVGDTIDQAHLEILGCIAGENVVFVSPKTIRHTENVYHSIVRLLKFFEGETDDE